MRLLRETELATARPREECFILKSAFAPAACDRIISYLGRQLNVHQPNARFEGENWYYTVTRKDTYFHSFMFHELAGVDCPELVAAYRELHRLYQALGETLDADFDALTTRDQGTRKTINPLVFWYPAGTGMFDWHQHSPEFQQFQLLMNLTQPGTDYVGGHTHVKLAEEHTEIFDAQFQKGDVFAFPYDKWHKVDPIMDGTSPLHARVSLLMPLHPRGGVVTQYR